MPRLEVCSAKVKGLRVFANAYGGNSSLEFVKAESISRSSSFHLFYSESHPIWYLRRTMARKDNDGKFVLISQLPRWLGSMALATLLQDDCFYGVTGWLWKKFALRWSGALGSLWKRFEACEAWKFKAGVVCSNSSFQLGKFVENSL